MTIAARSESKGARFTTAGREYVWLEGDAAHTPGAERLGPRRNELGEMLRAVVLPGLTRRRASCRHVGAGPRGGIARAHWSVWTAPGDRHPVWALWVPTRRLGVRALGARGRPANDGALLAAWGDGPALAWASDDPVLREALREALRALPDFLRDGLASADPTLRLRIVAA